MEYPIQQLVNGITLGSIYGLIAIGYTMVFGIIGMVNFAHGDVFMLSTFSVVIFLLVLTQTLGITSIALALLVVLLLAMLTTSLWAWAIERLAYRPLRGSFRLAPLISAIGMSILIMNFVQLVQGPLNKSVPPLVDGCFYGFSTPAKPCRIERVAQEAGSGPAILNIADKQLLIVGVNVVLLTIFWYLVQRTSLGRAQRACEQDGRMASLLGVDVNRTISITFVMGAALAAVAGQLYVVQYGSVNFADGFIPGVKAFTAAVLGGIGSLPGAVLGGLMIGLIEALWAGYVSSDYKDVAAFSILAIVLIFMPSGLLGRPEVEKV
jgi:branched-chain amino acid transport system permease protein